MNFLKNTLIVLTLISIGSYIDASTKTTRTRSVKRPQAQKPTTPSTVETEESTTEIETEEPTEKQEVQEVAQTSTATEKNFVKLYNEIRSMKPNQVIDTRTKQLFGPFLKDTVDKVFAQNLGLLELETLLRTARDQFVQFTGNNLADFNLLTAIDMQIDKAKQIFQSKTKPVVSTRTPQPTTRTSTTTTRTRTIRKR